MGAPDLTPFGYTPTETLVYQALLDLGPSSGYAIAKHVSIARANAYQALNGLAAKGAAALVDEHPQRFRAVQPQALLARITDAEARKLDRLENQLRMHAGEGVDAIVPLAGQRSIHEVATRTIVRAEGDVRCVAPADFVQALVPALRKRAVDGTPVRVWSIGAARGVPVSIERELADDTLAGFGARSVLIVTSHDGLAAGLADEARGYWTSDPLLVALIDAAITLGTT